MDIRLDGRVALVTGAAGGIGRATADALAASGAQVAVTDLDESEVAETADSINLAGGEAWAVGADLARVGDREALVGAVVGHFGRIDVLVNNAVDHGQRRPFLAVDDDDWHRVFEVNLHAAVALCRSAAIDMASRRSGAIVNIAAIQANLPLQTFAAYASSKGSLISFTRALAAELAEFGIRANAIAPGVVGTRPGQVTPDGADPERARSQVAALLGRWGRPAEVAAAAVFLASDAASFITGVLLPVDGGRSLSRLPDPFDVRARHHDVSASEHPAEASK